MSELMTPMDSWLRAKLGLSQGTPLTAEALAAYQLARLQATIAHVREHSPFHRARLAEVPLGFPRRLEDMSRLPLTTADDLRANHLAMLCVSQDQVSRVVTLRTSGTTADPKRLYFSDNDLEATLDFFHHGMATMVEPGDRVLILLPGATPDSVGDLLARALARMGVRGVVHGPLGDPGQALVQAEEHSASCLVGIPVQVLAMAEHPEGGRMRGIIKSVLLTTDYVPRALAARMQRAWGCEVFEHYGMTETGLGGGVDCRAHVGYHLRASDLYYEVVEPGGEAVLPVGQEGELVMTTLTREAMPLLRYRTGDLGRLLPGACACGGLTPRMARVPGRLVNRLDLGPKASLPMHLLDEALFTVAGVMDFRAGLGQGGRRFNISVQIGHDPPDDLAGRVEQALRSIPVLAERLSKGALELAPMHTTREPWPLDGSSKRTMLTPPA